MSSLYGLVFVVSARAYVGRTIANLAARESELVLVDRELDELADRVDDMRREIRGYFPRRVF